MTLTKLTADFKYTSYILAFDKDVVAASLRDRYSSSVENAGEAFLEKIIQVPLHLPSVEIQVLREFCFQGVDEAISIAEINLTQQQVQEFVRDFSVAFDDCLTTPRKAKLYGNTLLFSLPILKGEVNPIDLMLIEGIRVFCPSLYEAIRVNKKLFTGTLSHSQYSNNDTEKVLIKSIIDSAISKGKSIHKDGFIRLLKNMFPKLQSVYGNMTYGADWYGKWEQGQRICSENYFSRYFTYAVPRSDIPDKAILDLTEVCSSYERPFTDDSNPLNEYLNEKNAETLIKKLRQNASNMDSVASRSLALAIAQKSSNYPNPDVLFNHFTPFSQAAILVNDLVKNIDVSLREGLVCDCLDLSQSIEFQLEIFRWLERKEEDKPEKDAFSEESINKIGIHLSKSISEKIEKEGDITLIALKSIPTIFYTLNKYISSNFVDEYVKDVATKDHCIILRILDSFVPTAWGMETGVSHKSNFERQQYDSLTSKLDALLLMGLVEQYFPSCLEVLDEYPRCYDYDKDKTSLFVRQFVWLHRYVLNEENEQSEEIEDKAKT